jgi:hypothetical protein
MCMYGISQQNPCTTVRNQLKHLKKEFWIHNAESSKRNWKPASYIPKSFPGNYQLTWEG